MPDGRTVEYLRRRFIPRHSSQGALEVRSRAGERVDLLASRALGDPELYWHVLDTNPTLRLPSRSTDCEIPSDSVLFLLRLARTRS